MNSTTDNLATGLAARLRNYLSDSANHQASLFSNLFTLTYTDKLVKSKLVLILWRNQRPLAVSPVRSNQEMSAHKLTRC